MNELIKSLQDRWKKLTKTQKSIILVMLTAVFLAAIFFIHWLTRVEYAPLLTDLDPKNANAVIEKLKEMNVPYKLENQGTAIYVPEDKVYETRIQLAGEGVFAELGRGFELFDETKFGKTPFAEEVDYLRALQEELRRTIVAFDEVEQARVHLVLPKDSLFVEEEKEGSAAVTLKLKPLAQLTPEQVRGIIYLISNSVENLPPENVKVIDTTGKVLSDEVLLEEEASLTYAQLSQYELKRQYEKDLEKKVKNILDAVFGPGQALVMVTADLDFDRVEQRTVDYGEGSVSSQHTINEQSQSTGGAGGAVGNPNLTPQVDGYDVVDTGNANYQKNENTTNYKVDQTETTTVRAPGQPRSLSVSVVVNADLTQEEIDQVETMVATGIGLQPARGDQISVVGMNFQTGEEVLEETPESEPEGWPYYVWAAIGAGVLLLVGLFIWWRRKRALESTLAVEEMVPLAPVEPAPEASVTPPLTEEEKVRKEKQQHLKDLVRKNPEEAAQLIKVWLAED